MIESRQYLCGGRAAETFQSRLMKAYFATQRLFVIGAALTAGILIDQSASAGDPGSWKDDTISPVTNPIFFESPLIESDIHPLFIYNKIADDFVGGFARVYAVQARWAVTDRLAIIATKDGFVQIRAKALQPALNHDGWADIAAGLKYALIDDKEHQFVLTPGVKFEIPVGNERVQQGNGDGEFDVFVSAIKGWDKFHAMASFGGRIPIDMDAETSSLHYSLQLDYAVCKYFIPFATLNGFTWLSNGQTALTGNVEGYDLINFGSARVSGETEITLGVGFRSKLLKNLDVGFAWEKAVTDPKGLIDHRFTVDAVIHF
jgi:hypothetical protein